MNKKIIFLILGFLILVNTIDSVFAHGIRCGPTSGNVRIEDEIFSVQTSTTGDSFTISGTIIGLQNQENTPIKIFVKSNIDQPYEEFFHDLFYGNGNYDGNHASWYFKYEAKPREISISEGDIIDYKITVYPLKAGPYHVHSYLSDTEKHCRWGLGQTIIVEGREGVTDGEIFGFYLPILSSVALISFGTCVGIILIRRKITQKRK